MKSYKSVLHLLLTFILVATVFLASAPGSYAQEADQGWSEPVNVSLSGAASNPIMVVDTNNTIHAIWLDEVDGYKYSQSRDAGKTWSVAQTVKFPFDPKDPPPVLLPGPSGTIHVLWISSDHRLLYGRATPGDLAYPLNWVLNYPLSNSVASFNVFADAQGALHVAYVQNKIVKDNPVGIYYIQSPSAGGFWIEPRLLFQSDYFRTAKPNELYLRVSSSDVKDDPKVFVTWDDQAQKRIFMAVSKDSGQVWNSAQQIKGPDDVDGFDTPFNLTVASYGNNVLLLWQEGEPGTSQCTVYSQWSEDGGENWGEPIMVLGGRSECPLSINVVERNTDYFSVMLVEWTNPILVAWNGTQWSDAQSQIQLPSISNPLTFDSILLGCRFDLFYGEHLYVMGCDQARGGDVWFLSRTIAPTSDWFSPSEVLGEPVILSLDTKDLNKVSGFTSVADDAGNVHLVWAQSSVVKNSESETSIEYARWDGNKLTTPESVRSLNGEPLELSLTTDYLGRLLLTWIDGFNGDLIFSWANLERANLSSEWEEVTGLPVPSRLVNASDVAVDGSGRIINVYSVPINESRGVYITQSADGGGSWSSPIKVFDAISEEWEWVEQPRISIGAEGVLHLIFIRDSMREGQPVGLYYSSSVDGGATWSDARILSEGKIEWADIVSFSDRTVHVVWQEYDGLVFANISQFSADNGVTWGKQTNVTGVYENPVPISLVADRQGLLHFIQLIEDNDSKKNNQKALLLQDWKWDGGEWKIEYSKDLVIEGEDITYSLDANLTSTGYLCIFIPVEYINPTNLAKIDVLAFNRFLDDSRGIQPSSIPIIPAFNGEMNSEMNSETNNEVKGVTAIEKATLSPLLPTPDTSVLYSDNISASPLQKNIVGLVLLGLGVIATIVLLLWRRPVKRR